MEIGPKKFCDEVSAPVCQSTSYLYTSQRMAYISSSGEMKMSLSVMTWQPFSSFKRTELSDDEHSRAVSV